MERNKLLIKIASLFLFGLHQCKRWLRVVGDVSERACSFTDILSRVVWYCALALLLLLVNYFPNSCKVIVARLWAHPPSPHFVLLFSYFKNRFLWRLTFVFDQFSCSLLTATQRKKKKKKTTPHIAQCHLPFSSCKTRRIQNAVGLWSDRRQVHFVSLQFRPFCKFSLNMFLYMRIINCGRVCVCVIHCRLPTWLES